MTISHYIGASKKLSKKVIWKIDRVLFSGYFQNARNKALEQKRLEEERFRIEHPEEYYDKYSVAARHCFPVVGNQLYSVRDLILSQFVSGVYKGYDITVRLLAIEQYYGKNSIGYSLYRKMQSPTGFDWIPRYSKLIASYEQNGFEDDNPIEVDDHLTLMDGAHRLALALYHNDEIVPARIYKNDRERPYDYNWFWQMNFSADEISLIHNRTVELFNQCKYEYVAVIWSPAYQLRDEIINAINSYLHSSYNPPIQQCDCKVVKYEDVTLDKLDFFGFLRAMYYTDVMTEKGVQWKLKSMVDSMPDGCEQYPVRVFYIETLNPEIDRNVKNNTAKSMLIAKIKNVIRSRYKNRINKYEYDNIMHISDNYIQSKFCDLAVNIDKDVSDLFVQLNKQYDYVIAKAYGRQSIDFPYYYYYYYSDVDIVVRPSDVHKVSETAEKWLNEKYGGKYEEWLRVERRLDDEEQVEIQVSLRGWRYFLVHVQTLAHFSMDNGITDDYLLHRELAVNKPIYVLPPKYDMLIRLADLAVKPHKDWHRKYIAKHIDELDYQLAERSFNNNLSFLQNVKQIISEIRSSR